MTIMAGWRQAVVIARQALDNAAVDNRSVLSLFILSYLPVTSHHFHTLLSSLYFILFPLFFPFYLLLFHFCLLLFLFLLPLLPFFSYPSIIFSSLPPSSLTSDLQCWWITIREGSSWHRPHNSIIKASKRWEGSLCQVSEWVSVSVSEWVSQSVCQPVSQSVSRCVCECVSVGVSASQSVSWSVCLIHNMRAHTKQQPLFLTILSSHIHTLTQTCCRCCPSLEGIWQFRLYSGDLTYWAIRAVTFLTLLFLFLFLFFYVFNLPLLIISSQFLSHAYVIM